MLARQRIQVASNTRLDIIEVKDNIGAEEQRKVVGKPESRCVLVGQDLRNSDSTFRGLSQGTEYLTQESHANFKERREKIRHDVAESIPLFGFYLDLLKWFFIDPQKPKPEMDGIKVEIIH